MLKIIRLHYINIRLSPPLPFFFLKTKVLKALLCYLHISNVCVTAYLYGRALCYQIDDSKSRLNWSMKVVSACVTDRGEGGVGLGGELWVGAGRVEEGGWGKGRLSDCLPPRVGL